MAHMEGHHSPRDRYDVSGNIEAEYVDAEQTILVNKLGITDLAELSAREEEALVDAYEKLLRKFTQDARLTCDVLRDIHLAIFGEIYAWAGRWRTVWIKKPGITWPPPDFLEQAMREFEAKVLSKYGPQGAGDDASFCRIVAEIQAEFLVIHPFREGNARTVKLACDLLAAQSGRPLLRYGETEAGRQAYIAAAKAAFKHQYDPLVQIVAAALDRARQAPPDA